MGRLLTLLGVLLVFANVAFFLSAIQGLKSEWFAAFIQPIVCRGEETFYHLESTTDQIRMFCVEAETETSRDVAAIVMIGLIATFFGSFIGGMALMGIGSGITNKQKLQHHLPLVDSFTLRREMGIIEVEEAVELGMLSQGGAVSMQKVLYAFELEDMAEFLDQPLPQRLQQLEAARNQGLLSRAEHESLRNAIINHFSE